MNDLRRYTAFELTRTLCDIESVSGNEADIVSYVHDFLTQFEYLTTERIGNCIISRTNLGRPKRVVLAGHLDTVPISHVTHNFPSTVEVESGVEYIRGRGSVDMKAGDATFLSLAAHFAQSPDTLKHDITFIFYDNEEVDASKNGLGKLVRSNPDLLEGDFAILGEPTSSKVEAGCNGTMRFDITLSGKAAHSARAWVGENAIHKAARVLDILNKWNETDSFEDVEGLVYREGLNATLISGGIAPNVIPDKCTIHVNYRFAPSKTVEEAIREALRFFAGDEVVDTILESDFPQGSPQEFRLNDDATLTFRDLSSGARPGLSRPEVQDFARVASQVTKSEALPKYGWTDVARFTKLGIPALNFGPGDAMLAHHDDERVSRPDVDQAFETLLRYFKK
jgi:succinyl-diaminopimelate desuccinylase